MLLARVFFCARFALVMVKPIMILYDLLQHYAMLLMVFLAKLAAAKPGSRKIFLVPVHPEIRRQGVPHIGYER